MNAHDLVDAPVARQAEALSSGQLSPLDLLEAYLERIAARDPKLQAFAEVYADEARAAATAAEQAITAGKVLGPLHGVPIALKDVIEIQDHLTTAGSAAWAGRRSTITATLAQTLRAQGLIILGKTRMVEFAMGGWGTNERMGTPWNPWDPAIHRTPGGSSSGSGVAVAAGLAPWAIGTDTGGSVRLPAAACGISSLKPSRGRISLQGVLPLSPTLDTAGPMARCIDDVALLYAAMAGRDARGEKTQLPPQAPPVSSVRDGLNRGVPGLRLATLPAAERSQVSPAVLAAYDQAVDHLAGLGAEIIDDFKPPCSLEEAGRLNGLITTVEGYQMLRPTLEDLRQPLDEGVRRRLLQGRDIRTEDYRAALDRRRTLMTQWDEKMASVDALLTPTTAQTAIPLAEIQDGKTSSHFTRFVNLLDLCAAALPNGMDVQGLPTSLQVVGRRWQEATVLRVAQAYQTTTAWHLRRPPES